MIKGPLLSLKDNFVTSIYPGAYSTFEDKNLNSFSKSVHLDLVPILSPAIGWNNVVARLQSGYIYGTIYMKCTIVEATEDRCKCVKFVIALDGISARAEEKPASWIINTLRPLLRVS